MTGVSAAATTTFRYAGPLSQLSDADRSALFLRVKNTDAGVRATTAKLIERIRTLGDRALIEMARELDGTALANIEVPRSEISAALSSLDPSLRAALERAARNISAVHSASPPVTVEVETEPGVIVGRRPDPLRRVGAYAPGGRAAYASSVLMCVIPARSAGVEEVIVCSPPVNDGLPSQVVLAACAIAKADRVFAVGGAGAIAAMAFGTDTIPAVDKIVGPGNAYVAEAKVQLSKVVGIDSPAGPSELLVICGESCDSEVVALEILAQAEHDPDACVVVIASTEDIAVRIRDAVERLLPSISRTRFATQALMANGALLTGDIDDAFSFAAEYAPEHLLLAVENAEELLPLVRNAGCVFVGEQSSVVFGDYITGGNHVLPTAGAARSRSGLGALDFVRWTNYQRLTRNAAKELAQDAALIANAEGLYAHAAAAARWGTE